MTPSFWPNPYPEKSRIAGSKSSASSRQRLPKKKKSSPRQILSSPRLATAFLGCCFFLKRLKRCQLKPTHLAKLPAQSAIGRIAGRCRPPGRPYAPQNNTQKKQQRPRLGAPARTDRIFLAANQSVAASFTGSSWGPHKKQQSHIKTRKHPNSSISLVGAQGLEPWTR